MGADWVCSLVLPRSLNSFQPLPVMDYRKHRVGYIGGSVKYGWSLPLSGERELPSSRRLLEITLINMLYVCHVNMHVHVHVHVSCNMCVYNMSLSKASVGVEC
jgi:hypothetical protein